MSSGLDDYQRAVVSGVLQRPALVGVKATAGSGKTKTAVGSVKALIAAGMPANRILCTTFTALAGKEFKDRLAEEGVSPLPTVGTFHSVGRHELNCDRQWEMSRCSDIQGHYSAVASSAKIWRSVLSWSRSGPLGLTGEKPVKSTGLSAKDASSLVSYMRGQGWTPKSRAARSYLKDQDLKTSFIDAWKLFERSKKILGLWDFDDVLESFLAIAPKVDRYDVVFVDEAQDNSPVQWQIARALAKGGTLIAVGDLLQSIYSFRGASPDDFAEHCERAGSHSYALANNYRSKGEIVEVAERLALQYLPKWHPGQAISAPRGTGGTVATLRCLDPLHMGLSVASHINDALQRGKSPKQFCVLARTNAGASLIATSLGAMKIPYVQRASGGSVFSSYRGKCFLAYCVLAEVDHFVALDQIWNYPNRFLKRSMLESVGIAHEKDPTQPLSLCIRTASFTVAGKQRQAMKDLAALLDRIRSDDWATAVGALVDLLSSADKSVSISPTEDKRDIWSLFKGLAERFPDGLAFARYVTEVEESEQRDRDAKDPNAVTISTIHRAKGLEYDYVYLDLTERILPLSHAETPAQIEEEYRLAYVAMTRAREGLMVSYCDMDLRQRDAGPSRIAIDLELEG